jgi:hypothetical protein
MRQDTPLTKDSIRDSPECTRHWSYVTSRRNGREHSAAGMTQKHLLVICHKIYWKEAKVLQIETNTTYRRRKESAHTYLVDHTQLGHLSHLDSRYHSRSRKTTTPSRVSYVWKLCFYLGTIQRICLVSDDFYSDSTLILTTIAVK